MFPSSDLSIEDIKSNLIFDPETGVFSSLKSTSKRKAGEPCGTTTRDGYQMIFVGGKQRLAHRVAWAYVYGHWPNGYIDHKNGVRSDNRISNLAVVSKSENGQNLKMLVTNKSGFKGVSFDPRVKTWRATITIHKKRISLGSYATPEEASVAYIDGAKRYHTNNSAVDGQCLRNCHIIHPT